MGSSSALLELVPPHISKSLNYDLQRFDSLKRTPVDLVVVGAGPAGLAVAQRVSKEGVTVCCIDPNPQSVWPNNYGVWVDEFEDLDLLDCLDYTWASAVVYLDDVKKKTLERPYGRVNRTRLKSKMLEACIANGVQFHQSKVAILFIFLHYPVLIFIKFSSVVYTNVVPPRYWNLMQILF
jgi:lycopene beta-cyclase